MGIDRRERAVVRRGGIGTLGVAALAAALLLSGALVGVSYGGGGGITQPQVIELSSSGDVETRDYPLRDSSGRRNGGISMFEERAFDVDGNDVGVIRTECVSATGLRGFCTSIATLKDGPHTDPGTVVIEGVFRGFNGESFAVTGGTGAYVNVRGHATLTADGVAFIRTLFLIP